MVNRIDPVVDSLYERYAVLSDQKFYDGLTEDEELELEYTNDRLDAVEKDVYDGMINGLKGFIDDIYIIRREEQS